MDRRIARVSPSDVLQEALVDAARVRSLPDNGPDAWDGRSDDAKAWLHAVVKNKLMAVCIVIISALRCRAAHEAPAAGRNEDDTAWGMENSFAADDTRAERGGRAQ